MKAAYITLVVVGGLAIWLIVDGIFDIAMEINRGKRRRKLRRMREGFLEIGCGVAGSVVMSYGLWRLFVPL